MLHIPFILSMYFYFLLCPAFLFRLLHWNNLPHMLHICHFFNQYTSILFLVLCLYSDCYIGTIFFTCCIYCQFFYQDTSIFFVVLCFVCIDCYIATIFSTCYIYTTSFISILLISSLSYVFMQIAALHWVIERTRFCLRWVDTLLCNDVLRNSLHRMFYTVMQFYSVFECGVP